MLDYALCRDLVDRIDTTEMAGRVTDVTGLIVEAIGPPCRIGDLCHIEGEALAEPVPAEVVGLRDRKILLMPLGHTADIGTDSRVLPSGAGFTIPVGPELLGRILDGCARPIDGGPPLVGRERRSVSAPAPTPLERTPVCAPLSLNVRAIDGFLTCGRGQRIGIYSGPGVGKTTLLAMMARNAEADVTVLALVGERGREVLHFCHNVLGPEAMKRTVVVVATADCSALVRVKAAMVATTIAEYFRDEGKDALLVMDSLTRVAWAQREVGLAAGEPPTRGGFTPSAFALLPRLLERAGTSRRGTITAFYTILLEEDDLTGPVADITRATLDGHIVLSRALASRNHYPPIDVLASISRLMDAVVPDEHRAAAREARAVLAAYKESEDLISIGAYVPGSNPETDRAIRLVDKVNAILRQDENDPTPLGDTVARLVEAVRDQPPGAGGRAQRSNYGPVPISPREGAAVQT